LEEFGNQRVARFSPGANSKHFEDAPLAAYKYQCGRRVQGEPIEATSQKSPDMLRDCLRDHQSSPQYFVEIKLWL
jgi:hypothetical protein